MFDFYHLNCFTIISFFLFYFFYFLNILLTMYFVSKPSVLGSSWDLWCPLVEEANKKDNRDRMAQCSCQMGTMLLSADYLGKVHHSCYFGFNLKIRSEGRDYVTSFLFFLTCLKKLHCRSQG